MFLCKVYIHYILVAFLLFKCFFKIIIQTFLYLWEKKQSSNCHILTTRLPEHDYGPLIRLENFIQAQFRNSNDRKIALCNIPFHCYKNALPVCFTTTMYAVQFKFGDFVYHWVCVTTSCDTSHCLNAVRLVITRGRRHRSWFSAAAPAQSD